MFNSILKLKNFNLNIITSLALYKKEGTYMGYNLIIWSIKVQITLDKDPIRDQVNKCSRSPKNP